MSSDAPAIADTAPPAGRLRECADCGLIQHLPPLPRGSVARCPRCNAVLRRRRVDPAGRALALALTGILLFAIALAEPFIDIHVRGIARFTTLLSGPIALEQVGFWPLALAVLATTIAVPLARLLALAYVLLGQQQARPPRHLYAVFRWVERLNPWSMAEVFLLGVFVAYTRLVDIAEVEVGAAVYALGALALATAAADSVFDPEAVWQGLESRGIPPRRPDGDHGHGIHDQIGPLAGCDGCGLVSRTVRFCPRCGGRRRLRKADSLARTWALMLAAAVLYVPANLLPVMQVVNFGHGEADTILSGVNALIQADMWPLAALVFFASITVPMLKLSGLTWLLVSIQFGARTRVRERTRLFRIVDAVGKWSMIDVFMISILTALVRVGLLASVNPGPGAIAFCGVVILTILAAGSFDPRLIWDAAGRNEA